MTPCGCVDHALYTQWGAGLVCMNRALINRLLADLQHLSLPPRAKERTIISIMYSLFCHLFTVLVILSTKQVSSTRAAITNEEHIDEGKKKYAYNSVYQCFILIALIIIIILQPVPRALTHVTVNNNCLQVSTALPQSSSGQTCFVMFILMKTVVE